MENNTIDLPESEYEILPFQEEARDPSKTGPSPKKMVALEVYGYEVGRGKNKRIVTPDDVYKLAALGCTDREIATWFNTKDDTLRYNFADILAKGREDLKMALRQAMLKNALGGNAVMQIWLSKNYLGFSDNPNNSEDTKPLPWSDE
jgi:hypothetical protein